MANEAKAIPLFDVVPLDPEVEVEIREPRVAFLAGVLAGWTFGDKKLTADQREGLYECARTALRMAGALAKRTAS